MKYNELQQMSAEELEHQRKLQNQAQQGVTPPMTDEEYARYSPSQQQMVAEDAAMSEAPAELWVRPTGRGGYYQTTFHDEPDAVRYVRADLVTVWRHQGRGGIYQELGRAELQAADRNAPHPVEGDALVIYRGTDGKLWARWDREFEDGRFSRVEADYPR